MPRSWPSSACCATSRASLLQLQSWNLGLPTKEEKPPTLDLQILEKNLGGDHPKKKTHQRQSRVDLIQLPFQFLQKFPVLLLTGGFRAEVESLLAHLLAIAGKRYVSHFSGSTRFSVTSFANRRIVDVFPLNGIVELLSYGLSIPILAY